VTVPTHVIRAERAVVETAAAHLRTTAIQDGYAGQERKDLAFALALVLDEVARHMRDLPPGLRTAIVRACRDIAPESP
jgi:hypothetical protein